MPKVRNTRPTLSSSHSLKAKIETLQLITDVDLPTPQYRDDFLVVIVSPRI